MPVPQDLRAAGDASNERSRSTALALQEAEVREPSSSHPLRKDDPTLEEALLSYRTIYMPSRNLAPRTRVEYANDIEQLIAFLEDSGRTRVGQVSMTDLEAFLAHLDGKGYSDAARRRKAYAIKSFFSFLEDADVITTNPAGRLTPPKQEKKEPRVLTEEEYKALLRACSHKVRDAAIIELLLQTGIRLSELAGLTVADVNLPRRISRNPADTGSLHVKGMGRKERTIPLNYKACKVLEAWLTIRPEVDHDSLFVSKFRKPMSPRAFQCVVKKHLREAGIRGASVHTLRHTFATHHVARGTSLRSVQEALGHESLKTTSVYVSLARKLMRKELQEYAL